MRPALATEGSGAAPLAVRLGRTLAIGTVGGAIFAWMNLPLAWMLGAMVATTAASLGGAKLYVPGPMRSIMVAIIGVLLGASFTPEIVEKAGEWPLTIGCLVLYLGFLIGILFLYFHRIVGLDAPTAYFSATPGGLSEMVITGAAMGADDRTIALIHTARVLLVVLAVPLWFRYTTGVTTTPSAIGPSIGAIGLTDIAVLTTCAIAGAAAGRLIRLPAYRLSGPLLASAFVHVQTRGGSYKSHDNRKRFTQWRTTGLAIYHTHTLHEARACPIPLIRLTGSRTSKIGSREQKHQADIDLTSFI